jgi:hypothetical protein
MLPYGSLAPGKAFVQCMARRRLTALSSESTKTLAVDREVGFTPTMSTLAVVVSSLSTAQILSLVCVGSFTSYLISSVAERRSKIMAGRPSPVRAARVLDDAMDDCDIMESQLLPGLPTSVLSGVVGAFTAVDECSTGFTNCFPNQALNCN